MRMASLGRETRPSHGSTDCKRQFTPIDSDLTDKSELKTKDDGKLGLWCSNKKNCGGSDRGPMSGNFLAS
jgi:hypothetical protein